ncbi:MAG TPA: hypothetical protein VMU50_06195 [Polyangia bacterium]|nr:hypothetical protein [Polyangia bacterium]
MSVLARLRGRSPGFWFAVLFGAGVACALPALGIGFYADDYVQVASLRSDAPLGRRIAAVFAFSDGEQGTKAAIADGSLPWWTSPQFRVRFFRPLSGALLAADQALFGLAPLGYHVHSLLWWILWLAGTALLLRWVLSPPLALLAFALFALDDAHWAPIGWIAGRNASVSMAGVVWGLVAYLRFRQDGWRPGAALAVGAWALALLGGEVALSGLMYVVAYELVRARPDGVAHSSRSWRSLRALLPLVLLLAAYAVVYRLTGSGVGNSGVYADPVRDTAAFVAAALRRVPAQWGGLLVSAPLDLWVLTRAQPILTAIGVVAAAAGVPWFWAASRALAPSDREAARWLALGAALSLPPTSAGLLGERSLAAAGMGGAVMLAVMLRHAWQRWRARVPRGRIVAGAGVLVLGLANLVLTVPWLETKLLFARANGRAAEHLALAAAAAVPPPAHAVLLWSDDFMVGSYTPVIARLYQPGALPRFRTLAMAPVDLRMTRAAPDTLDLACTAGTFLGSEWERLFRAGTQPLGPGTIVPLDGLTVEIRQVSQGRPTVIRFRFDAPLEDPSLRFLEWRGRRLRPLALPPIGETRPVYRSPPVLIAPDESDPPALLNHGQ